MAHITTDGDECTAAIDIVENTVFFSNREKAVGIERPGVRNSFCIDGSLLKVDSLHARGCHQIFSCFASLLGPALIAAVAALHLSIGIVEASTAGILLNFCGIGAAERARRSCLNW